jgi:hypothetical protein
MGARGLAHPLVLLEVRGRLAWLPPKGLGGLVRRVAKGEEVVGLRLVLQPVSVTVSEQYTEHREKDET